MKLTEKYNEAVVCTSKLEHSAETQIQMMCDYEPLKDSHIRIMPDVNFKAGDEIKTRKERR